jgi:hypothetical protein
MRQRERVTGDSRHWLGFRKRVKTKVKTSTQRRPIKRSREYEARWRATPYGRHPRRV